MGIPRSNSTISSCKTGKRLYEEYVSGGPFSPEIYLINGEKVTPVKVDKDWAQYPKLIEHLNKLGREGWEIVSISPAIQPSGRNALTHIYLKRQMLD